MTRRALAIALLAGALGGGVAAVVHGQAPSRPPPLRTGSALPDPARLPDGRYDPGRVHYVVDRSTVRIDARVVDPDGGPDWVVRVFDARRVSIREPQRTLARPLFAGEEQCAELGREYRGRFGWIYSDGVWRPVAPARAPFDAQWCDSRKRPRREARFLTTVRMEDPSLPTALRSVLWGRALPGEAVTARGDAVGGRRRLSPGRAGGFLALAAPDAGIAGLTVRAGPRTIRLARSERRPRGAPRPRRPTRIVVEAPAPDPAGGPASVVAVGELPGGRTCVMGTASRLGARLGSFAIRDGLFSEQPPARCSSNGTRRGPTRKQALQMAGFAGGDGLEGQEPERARVERRLAGGFAELLAVCHPDVVRVTLRTAQDIRTLVPSARGHVIHARYAGFSPGDMVVVARFRDGTTRRQRLPGF